MNKDKNQKINIMSIITFSTSCYQDKVFNSHY